MPFDFRNKEKAEIFSYVRKSVNTFVCGAPGIGKTTLIKSVVDEVNGKLGLAVYVDCFLYPTANAVLRETLTALGSVIASKSNYELTKRLKEKTKKTKLFVFIDHFESLKTNDILNIFLGLDFCICLVADYPQSYRFLNSNHRAKFTTILKIERLSTDQIVEILREEADSKTTDEAILDIAEKCEGNIALALDKLRSFGVNRGKTAFEQIDLSEKAPIHCEDHSVILGILKQQNRLPSGELYNLYCQKSELSKSERSFRNFMQTLCKQGLVKSIGDKRGRSYQIVEPKGIVNG
jgi:hypothetical protein